MPSKTEISAEKYAEKVLSYLENIEEPWRLASQAAQSSKTLPKEMPTPSWRLNQLRESMLGNFVRGVRRDLNAAEMLLASTEVGHGAREARRVLANLSTSNGEETRAVANLGNAEAVLHDLPSRFLKMGAMTVGAAPKAGGEGNWETSNYAANALKTLDRLAVHNEGTVYVTMRDTGMPLNKSTPSFLLLRDMLTMLSHYKLANVDGSLVESMTQDITADLRLQLKNGKVPSDTAKKLDDAIEELSALPADLKELNALAHGRAINGAR